MIYYLFELCDHGKIEVLSKEYHELGQGIETNNKILVSNEKTLAEIINLL